MTLYTSYEADIYQDDVIAIVMLDVISDAGDIDQPVLYVLL